MAILGILRRINKNLPNLLQVILFICLIHYLGQGVLLKIQKKFQLGRYGRFSSATGTNTANKKTKLKLKKINANMMSHRKSSTTTTTPPPPPPFYVTEEVIHDRIQVLQNACKKWNLGMFAQEGIKLSEEDETEIKSLPKNPLYQALFVSEKYKISFCPVARSGLNWISKRLLELTGLYTPDEISHLRQPPGVLARQQYPYLASWEKYIQVLPEFVNFIVVRHPFDRLLASYRNMLENAEKDPHNYLKYGRRIIRSYRKENGGGKEPTFPEFISFLIERDIKYLDEAWQPVSRRCSPCHIPFTVILHFETLWNDALWTWKRANLPSLNTTDYVTNSITTEVRRNYFSEISLHQLAKLYNKYRLDFNLFGYKIDEHLLYSKPGFEPLTPDILKLLTKANEGSSNKNEGDEIKAIPLIPPIENKIGFQSSSQSIIEMIKNKSEKEEQQIKSIQSNQIDIIMNHPEVAAAYIPN